MYRPRNSLPLVSETVMQAGLAYAREKCGIEPNPDLLRLLYDKTRARRFHMKCSFREARAWALDMVFVQRNHEEQTRYKKYERILGKMANKQKELMQDAVRKTRERTAQERIMDHVQLGRDNRQFEFIL